jgi:hypothetical protein
MADAESIQQFAVVAYLIQRLDPAIQERLTQHALKVGSPSTYSAAVILSMQTEMCVEALLHAIYDQDQAEVSAGHVHFFGQFSAGCEAPICCAFLLIYGALAMDSSKIGASGASRLAEILPAKVNKASLRLSINSPKSTHDMKKFSNSCGKSVTKTN